MKEMKVVGMTHKATKADIKRMHSQRKEAEQRASDKESFGFGMWFIVGIIITFVVSVLVGDNNFHLVFMYVTVVAIIGAIIRAFSGNGNDENSSDDFIFNNDDLLTNPAYHHLPANIFNDD